MGNMKLGREIALTSRKEEEASATNCLENLDGRAALHAAIKGFEKRCQWHSNEILFANRANELCTL